MTAERVRALQALVPLSPGRFVRVTIAGTAPLFVTLPGGATLPGVAVQGHTYTAGAAAWAWYDEPAVGPVFPNA